jgi:hypothetical protein
MTKTYVGYRTVSVSMSSIGQRGRHGQFFVKITAARNGENGFSALRVENVRVRSVLLISA